MNFMKGKAAGDSGVDSAVATWGHQSVKDFFVSYTGKDGQWAQWIAWVLEEAGYSTVIQAWDILPGNNFLEEMDRATREAERTIAVLSAAYFQSKYTGIEWQVAFRKDSQGHNRTLIPIRIQNFDIEGLLGSAVYIDLVNLSESEAEQRILNRMRAIKAGRGKPETRPKFPKTAFPGVPQPNANPPQQTAQTVEILSAEIANPQTTVGQSTPRLSEIDRLLLETKQEDLAAKRQQYDAVAGMLRDTIDPDTCEKLSRKLKKLEGEMREIAQAIAELDGGDRDQ